jgi:glycosyltransferase involved in cell wall biosynthesis
MHNQLTPLSDSYSSSDSNLTAEVRIRQAEEKSPGITVCCTFGDPLSPKTWSGTPAKICTILQEHNVLDGTINSNAFSNRINRKLISTLSSLYYQGSKEHYRGKIVTQARARYVDQLLASSKSDVLHFGIDHLPLKRCSSNRNHYLYIDATWNITRKNLPHDQGGDRLNQDIEESTQAIFDQMTHIFPIGEYLRDHIIEQYNIDPAKVTAVGTGRGSLQPYYGEVDYENPTVLYAAKWGFEYKGGDLVVEGFQLAHQQNPKLKLVLVGQDSYQQQFGHLPGVTTYGFTTFEQLQEIFNSAALFALPARLEPWGMAYLEALSCRTPLIGLNRYALPEMTQNGKYGFLMAEATPEAFAATLLKACEDPERLRKMGAEGQKYCLEKYTWEQTVETMLSVIEHQ